MKNLVHLKKLVGLLLDCGKVLTYYNGALAHFAVINRAVARCFKKVGQPGYRDSIIPFLRHKKIQVVSYCHLYNLGLTNHLKPNIRPIYYRAEFSASFQSFLIKRAVIQI